MLWHTAETDENFPELRLVSEGGRWEMGLLKMGWGNLRIRVGLVGDFGPSLDYCPGNDQAEIYYWFGIISGLMMRLPEDVTQKELRMLFPMQHIKPLSKDPVCRECLMRLIDVLAHERFERRLRNHREAAGRAPSLSVGSDFHSGRGEPE